MNHVLCAGALTATLLCSAPAEAQRICPGLIQVVQTGHRFFRGMKAQQLEQDVYAARVLIGPSTSCILDESSDPDLSYVCQLSDGGEVQLPQLRARFRALEREIDACLRNPSSFRRREPRYMEAMGPESYTDRIVSTLWSDRLGDVDVDLSLEPVEVLPPSPTSGSARYRLTLTVSN